MFKKILKRKKPILAALGIVTAMSLTAGMIRPAVQAALYPDAAAVSAAKKQLPIYCVDTQGKKQVSISFDAAWGAGNLRRNLKMGLSH